MAPAAVRLTELLASADGAPEVWLSAPAWDGLVQIQLSPAAMIWSDETGVYIQVGPTKFRPLRP